MTEMVSDAGNKRPLVYGVDTLRIVAAIWVACGHGAFLNVKALLGTHFGALSALFGVLFSGSAAVVIFFIISGFCIHYPNINKASLDWKTFLVRRAARIGIPLLAIVLITRLLGNEYVESENAVLWSLYCEIIYYALYPILFIIERNYKIKIGHVLWLSVFISVAMLLTRAEYMRLWEFGYTLTWLFCAPAWLLGACLAEYFTPNSRRLLPGSLWYWRLCMIGLGSLSTLLLFHTPAQLHFTIGVPWTIIPIVGLAYFWVHDELLSFRLTVLTAKFETLGRASYSLYLIHKIGITALSPMAAHMNALVFWLIELFSIAAASAAFYFAVERPSHIVAKRVKIGKSRRKSESHSAAEQKQRTERP